MNAAKSTGQEVVYIAKSVCFRSVYVLQPATVAYKLLLQEALLSSYHRQAAAYRTLLAVGFGAPRI